MGDSAPAEEYGKRLADHRNAAESLDAVEGRIAVGRLVVFIVALVVAFRVVRAGLPVAWLGVPIVLFVALVILHERTIRRKAHAERAAALYERGIERLEDRWAGVGPTGAKLTPIDHPYAIDLDVTGQGSLFQLLATARTGPGRESLARWLLQSSTIDEARARSEAAEELAPRVDLREDVALLGEAVRDEVEPDALRRWAASPYLMTPTLKAVALGFTGAVLVSAALWAAKITTGAPLILSLIGVMGFMTFAGRRVNAVVAGVEEPARELRVLASVLDRIESEAVTSPYLTSVKAELEHDGVKPVDAVKRLTRLVDLIDSARNQFFGPIAFVTLWHAHLAGRVEVWRARFGPDLDRWLTRAGELDALLAVSGFAYEHPDYVRPAFEPGDAVVRATSLGHPLIPRTECVHNDVALGGGDGPHLLVVSGSNMSGKSTLLRAIGINVVLAFLGAPVCASAFTTSHLAIGASIRTTDSLHDGRSRFFAEITRLKALVDLAKGGAVQGVEAPTLLFLIDEILAGTNSHDRRKGAEALLTDLVAKGAVGAATTHDLALTEIAERIPHTRNAHFSDTFVDDRIVFDYQLRDGVVQTSNALQLMRSVGLDV